MSFALKLLRNRWLLGGAATLALALLAWFVGDAIAFGGFRPLESEASRRWTIVALVLAWIGIEAVRQVLIRRADRRLIRSIAGAGDDSAQARASAEVETLRRRFEEATATLRQAKLQNRAGERRHLYQLPWYVIVGAPGSGKTTALVNSGLRFPLEAEGAGQSVKGVGGTRNCDWWFTDEAVLLDTAGRYTTQDSESEVDTAAWRGFLDLLKKFRPRQPINGALVTVSISDLLSQNDEARREYARQVRRRVRELSARLGVRFPIYLMVTKTDLLAGFMEFFGDLPREAREQVWGSTFALDSAADAAPADPGTLVATRFTQLERRLYSLLLERLREERDPQRRGLVYTFPEQFAAIGPLLSRFVARAFRETGGGARPMLRGVYFTSGTQEGSPIDRVLGRLARSFNLERKVLPPAASSGKSFFLNRLLRDVVFQEAGLAGLDERLEARRRRWTALAYAAFALVLACLVAAWTASYVANRAWVEEARAGVAAAKRELDALPPAPQGESAAIVRALDALRQLPRGYAERSKPPARLLGLGLYQRGLADREVEVYRNMLADVLMPRVAHALQLEMRSAQARPALAESLEAYDMLYERRALDAATFVRAASRILPGSDPAALGRHLAAALETRPYAPSAPYNAPLVADARRRLAAAPEAR